MKKERKITWCVSSLFPQAILVPLFAPRYTCLFYFSTIIARWNKNPLRKTSEHNPRYN